MQRILMFVAGTTLFLTIRVAQAEDKPEIVWRTNLFTVTNKATAEGIPMVVFFCQDTFGDNPSDRLRGGALSSPEFAKFAGKAVFVQVWLDLDDKHGNGKFLIESLEIKQAPAVSIINCTPDNLAEIGTIRGYFDTADFMRQFDAIFSRAVKQQGMFEAVPAREFLTPIAEDGASEPGSFERDWHDVSHRVKELDASEILQKMKERAASREMQRAITEQTAAAESLRLRDREE